MASTNVDPSADLAPKTGDSKTAQYLMCSTCKSAYVADETLLNSRVGLRVRCGVCEKEWFQSIERLSTLDNSSQLGNMSEEKIADVKRILAESNFPKYPRVDRIGLFVGNLPYSYDDKDLLDLFCDYGVTSVALVRDNEGLSKGFAFVEVSRLLNCKMTCYYNRRVISVGIDNARCRVGCQRNAFVSYRCIEKTNSAFGEFCGLN